jgi:hypothetical protein
MELKTYNDPLEFSLYLREGVKSLDNFIIAVVPGGQAFATEYARDINDFTKSFANDDANFQNFKFISTKPKFLSTLNVATSILGTQSNLNIPV